MKQGSNNRASETRRDSNIHTISLGEMGSKNAGSLSSYSMMKLRKKPNQ
jgi:hypothetical protein